MIPQPRAVDIHEWYRTGGTDWPRLHANFDVVGIRAGQGVDVDALLVEHIDKAKYYDIPYFTYWIPEQFDDPIYQADKYLDQYGVLDGLACMDIEPAGGGMVIEYQARKFIERVDAKHRAQCWYYSNYPYTNDIGNPGWIKTRPVFWAEYRYQFLFTKYRKFEPFLEKYPWWPTRWATALGIDVTLHQFTDYGDAQYYLANAKTDDEYYRDGIKSADLSVGLVDLKELLALWNPVNTIPPPVSDAEKLSRLWNYHPNLH